MKKNRDLLIVTAIYLLAFLVGWLAARQCSTTLGQLFVFDVAATVVTFVFSVLLHNSSVYDAYWSLTPMVMAFWLFRAEKAASPMQLAFLLAFQLWGARLTLNWVSVFTDFSYEDWRYRKYREETPRIFWPIVNFWGIHMMPTLVVFAGMLPMFEIAKNPMNLLALPGIAVMLCGVGLEFFADRQMHRHLQAAAGKSTCRIGLWRYSRHPNYLGEITHWLGVYLVMLPFAPEKWYYGVGALSVAILFNVVSVPLMEKRQLQRRSDYAQYRQETSRLLLRPVKHS